MDFWATLTGHSLVTTQWSVTKLGKLTNFYAIFLAMRFISSQDAIWTMSPVPLWTSEQVITVKIWGNSKRFFVLRSSEPVNLYSYYSQGDKGTPGPKGPTGERGVLVCSVSRTRKKTAFFFYCNWIFDLRHNHGLNFVRLYCSFRELQEEQDEREQKDVRELQVPRAHQGPSSISLMEEMQDLYRCQL